MKRQWTMVLVLLVVLLITGCTKLSVAFDAQNETAIFLQEVDKNQRLSPPVEPQMEGHTFLGWYTDLTSGERWDFSQPVRQDMNLYARWEPIDLEITFVTHPTQNQEHQVVVPYGNTVPLPPLPEIPGYRFTQWTEDASGSIPWKPGNAVQKEMTLYAQWEPLVASISYQKQTDEHQYVSQSINTYHYGEEIVIATPEPLPGFAFIGWNTKEDGSGQMYEPGDVLTMGEENITLYPQWATPVIASSAGSSHSMVLLADGTLLTVGSNTQGQLGDGTRKNQSSPVPVASSVSEISAGGGFSLFIDTQGTLWGMGGNYQGQLGNPNLYVPLMQPVRIMDQVRDVAAGGSHTLVLREDGTLWAMGNNEDGQLGDGTTSSRNAPVHIADAVQHIAAGAYHSLFITEDGTLWGMGWNESGQLGDDADTSQKHPVKIMDNVQAVAAGEFHTLMLTMDGVLMGLGANTHRQLGISSVEETSVPVELATKAHAIAAGYNHSWYIDDAGNLWGTGDNAYGQLDPENTAQIDTWQPLYESVDAVAAGKDFSLIISQGRLFAIGSNEYGQLGDWEK